MSKRLSGDQNDDGPLLRKVRLAVAVIEMKGLPAMSRLIFAELLLGFHNTKTGRCDPKASVIGERLGRSEEIIIDNTAPLKKAGLLTVSKRRRGSPMYGFPGLAQDPPFLAGLGQDDPPFSTSQDPPKMARQDPPETADLNTENQNTGELNLEMMMQGDDSDSVLSADTIVHEAAKIAGLPQDPSTWPARWRRDAAAQVQAMLDGGRSRDDIIRGVTVTTNNLRRLGNAPPKTFNYYTDEIAASHAKRTQAAATTTPTRTTNDRRSGATTRDRLRDNIDDALDNWRPTRARGR